MGQQHSVMTGTISMPHPHPPSGGDIENAQTCVALPQHQPKLCLPSYSPSPLVPQAPTCTHTHTSPSNRSRVPRPVSACVSTQPKMCLPCSSPSPQAGAIVTPPHTHLAIQQIKSAQACVAVRQRLCHGVLPVQQPIHQGDDWLYGGSSDSSKGMDKVCRVEARHAALGAGECQTG